MPRQPRKCKALKASLKEQLEVFSGDIPFPSRKPRAEQWYPELEVRVRRHGNPIVEVRISDLPETREKLDGNIAFAYEVVPTLSEEDFEVFKNLFWTISDILPSDMKPSVTA